jgi:hypothetical protein
MAIRVIEVPSSVRFDPPPHPCLENRREPTIPMSKASPDDVFTDPVEWDVAAAADYLGERGAQIIDWAWKQGVISVYGQPTGKKEVVEIIFRREGGRIDFVDSRLRLATDVTHERLTIRWVDVKRLAQFDVDLLKKWPDLLKEDPEKDLLTEREREIVREAVAGARASVQPADEQLNQYVAVQDDRDFQNYMTIYGDMERARSALEKQLTRNGRTDKTAANRASAAKTRFKK